MNLSSQLLGSTSAPGVAGRVLAAIPAASVWPPEFFVYPKV